MSELAVALDFQTRAEALSMASRLQGTATWMKIGLELFCAEGPGLVEEVRGLGFKVFLDLKFFDIPNTVKGAVRSAAAAGADMVNIHALGGRRMAEAALEGRELGARGGKGPLVLAVTILTSMDEDDLGVLAGSGMGSPGDLVLDLARRAKAYYLDGVVCSGQEVAGVKAALGSDFICLTPGIRPAGSAAGDQRRVVTPRQAVADGSDFLVVGRPITGSDDPAKAAREVLEQMRRV